MDDIKLAMLGSKEAAKRLTEAGVLLACPWCGGIPTGIVREYSTVFDRTSYIVDHNCKILLVGYIAGTSKENAIERWNTRAPILSESEMEMLEGMK